MSDLSCGRMRQLAAELALDVLTGYERAEAQAHLNRCPECREYVRSLTLVGDRLLGLVPGAEPPVGFEDRVLARMGMLAPARRPERRHRWLPLAVAAAVAAMVFGVGGWLVADTGLVTVNVAGGDHASQEVLRFAELRASDQRQVGQVFTYLGSPAWLYMTVDADPSTTSVSCELERKDGTMVWVGKFDLTNGKGSWGTDLTVNPSNVTGARLVSNDGKKRVLAIANFGSGPAVSPRTSTPH
jgi:hypothetical protein